MEPGHETKIGCVAAPFSTTRPSSSWTSQPPGLIRWQPSPAGTTWHLWWGTRGVTVFLNTHNLSEAEKLCAQVGVIRQGKLLTVGNPDALRVKEKRASGGNRGARL